MLVGFTPGAATLRWTSQIPPTDPLKATDQWFDADTVQLAGGRVVAAYTDLSLANHLVALDAKTGRTLWDVTAMSDHRTFALTATRIYEMDSPNVGVRDAATGKLLGSVGSLDRLSHLH